jgi:putative ABC transport system permease protein
MQEELQTLAELAGNGELGNLTLAAEDARAAWGWNWLSSLWTDVRYGFRTLINQPGFLAAAVATLALGVGANTAIFSLINATILRPLPFPNASRLVLIWKTFGPGPDNENIISAPDYWDFARQTRSFENVAIFDSSGAAYNLSAKGQDPEQIWGLRVSASFFAVLGVKPMLGRTFLREEELKGRDREVLLSYGLWKARYAGNPGIVGETVQINGAAFVVIGVMPEAFAWQAWGPRAQLWVPVGYTETDYGRGNNSFVSIARLKPGITIAQARSDVAKVAKQLAKQYPIDDAGISGTVDALADWGLQDVRRVMFTLLSAVGLVLLIACVNVANLMLARSAARQKEISIRRALGAPGWRIARQLLTESVVLAFMGGAIGLVLAFWSGLLLFHLLGPVLQLPMRPFSSVPLDGRVLLFALGVSCLTGLAFGVVPAFSALRSGMNEGLKQGGRNSSESDGGLIRHLLVASEVSLALIILTAAALMIKSTSRLLGVDPGFDSKSVLTMQVSLPQQAIYTGPPGLPLFCRDLSDHVNAVPGVMSSSAIAHLPLEGNAGRSFQIEGRAPADPAHMPGGSYSVACPDYFRTMGIHLVKGREFSFHDTLNSQGVVIINEAMARKYWPNEEPLGRAIRFGGSDGPRLVIVGVAEDVRFQSLDRPASPQLMRPYTQAGWPLMNIVVRTRTRPETLVVPVKKAIREFMPDRPVAGFGTMEELLRESVGSRLIPMLLLSTFSMIALLLAAVGITGVVGYSVTQRTEEIGIRLALGARSSHVHGMVLASSMKWTLAGLIVGVPGSVGVGHLLSALLYEVRPIDVGVLGTVCAVLVSVALVASFIPAHRAAGLDPVQTLRRE